MKNGLLIFCFFILIVTNLLSQQTDFPKLTGPYLGQKPPGMTPEIFAPGLTTVTYTLDDGNGNSSQCTFTVTHQAMDDIVVSSSEGILTVETTGSYQWISCEDNAVIEGETGSTYNPGLTGEYAVIVTQGECSVTSQCIMVDVTGLELNGNKAGLEVYPNPADQFISIKLDRENTNVTIKVVNTTGQAVLVETMDRLSKTNLDISKFKSGIYLVQIHSDQMDRIVRVMKE